MDETKHIRAQARVAHDLMEQRQQMLGLLPFGEEMNAPRPALDQVSAPVVAVAGAYSVGKSHLINRLAGADVLPVGVTPTTMVPVLLRHGSSDACQVAGHQGMRSAAFGELRAITSTPDPDVRYVSVDSSAIHDSGWHWLDVPGANSQRGKPTDLKARPQDLATICIFATSALQPLSLTDVNQLLQLTSAFPGDRLCLAITRWDQLPEKDADAVRSYVKEVLDTTVPGIKLFETSPAGINELNAHLAASIYTLQHDSIKSALSAWKETLSELQALLQLRDLHELKPATIDRIGARLDSTIINAGLELREMIPPLLESLLRQHASSIPAPQRALTQAIEAGFQSQLGPKLGEIPARLNTLLRNELQKDLAKKTSLALTDRFSAILSERAPFFDWRSAAAGGAGAAMLGAALVTGPVGWVLAGGALLGGLMGGLLGTASTIESASELRQKVGQPIAAEYHAGIEHAVASVRWDIQQLCQLLQKVVRIFAGSNGARVQQDDADRYIKLIKLAETQRKQLAGRLSEIESERRAEMSPEERADQLEHALVELARNRSK